MQFFLDELASKAPTPGGGSVSALMGAQSAALTGMVCHLTIGKAKFADVEDDMRALLAQSEALRSRLTDLIQQDIDVFNRLMAAYALPKGSEQETAIRGAAIQTALCAAMEVPLDCARACREAVELSRAAALKGNPAAVSDAGVAVMAAYGGLKSAVLNVYINAGGIKDKAYTEAKLAELKAIAAGADAAADDIYRLTLGRL